MALMLSLWMTGCTTLPILEPFCSEGQDYRTSKIRMIESHRMLEDGGYQETLIWIKWANTEYRANCRLAGKIP